MTTEDQFVGRWRSTLPYDSDDYLVEYVISREGDGFHVEARDLQDSEEMVISDVTFDRETLSFVSHMPSTGRKGVNKFRLKEADLMEVEFTFTVVEELKRWEMDQ